MAPTNSQKHPAYSSSRTGTTSARLPRQTSTSPAIMDAASRFLSQGDLGLHGKMLGISKMFQDRDIAMLKMKKTVVTLRPRGVLSGFLAVVPSVHAAVYIPPVGSKIPAIRLHMRLDEQVWQQGVILSCYWDETSLVLEDILQWGDKRLWSSVSFEHRWSKYMQAFCDAWMPDSTLCGCSIRLAEYMTLDQLDSQTLNQVNNVIEFIWAEDAGMRRFIWVPDKSKNDDTSDTSQIKVVRRESQVGPDIFSIWSLSGERIPNYALVRTLAISRALRLHSDDEFRVRTTWNSMFERHEILSIEKPHSSMLANTTHS